MGDGQWVTSIEWWWMVVSEDVDDETNARFLIPSISSAGSYR